MDYKSALNELYQELHRLGEVIKNLESLETREAASAPVQTWPKEHACRGTSDSF